jgi:hypothetical protein
MIALAAAFVLRPFPIPEVVSSGLDALASLVVPLIMLSVGLTLEVRRLADRPAALGSLGAVRLLLAPLVALAVGGLVLDDPAAVRLVVLEAGMPTMMLTIVIGARFGLDTEFLASRCRAHDDRLGGDDPAHAAHRRLRATAARERARPGRSAGLRGRTVRIACCGRVCSSSAADALRGMRPAR